MSLLRKTSSKVRAEFIVEMAKDVELLLVEDIAEAAEVSNEVAKQWLDELVEQRRLRKARHPSHGGVYKLAKSSDRVLLFLQQEADRRGLMGGGEGVGRPYGPDPWGSQGDKKV